jgi:hypothetical protein
MDAPRLAWPEDRRLFRRERGAARGLQVFLVAIAAVLVAALGFSGIA